MEAFMEILVHAVRASRYRFIRATEGAKENFGDYKVSVHTRSPKEIINHLYDLANKTRQMIAMGNFECVWPQVLAFDEEKERFLGCLEELEAVMLAANIEMDTAKRLLQGPVLDMATHVGQLAMLNGLNGNKVPKESYYEAEI